MLLAEYPTCILQFSRIYAWFCYSYSISFDTTFLWKFGGAALQEIILAEITKTTLTKWTSVLLLLVIACLREIALIHALLRQSYTGGRIVTNKRRTKNLFSILLSLKYVVEMGILRPLEQGTELLMDTIQWWSLEGVVREHRYQDSIVIEHFLSNNFRKTKWSLLRFF